MRAGKKVLTLRVAIPCEGEAHDRKRLEQLCRSIIRPTLSDERVQLNATGPVELKLKTRWRDWTTHSVMRPLEFLQRLAARATEGLSCRGPGCT